MRCILIGDGDTVPEKKSKPNDGAINPSYTLDLYSASHYQSTLTEEEKLIAENDREQGLEKYSERDFFLRTRDLHRLYLHLTIKDQFAKFSWLENVSVFVSIFYLFLAKVLV